MLNCQIHDYVEIACLFRMLVRLNMKDSSSFEGEAQDVVKNDLRQECFLLKNDDGMHQLVLNEIQSMQALVKNQHFDVVEFE